MNRNIQELRSVCLNIIGANSLVYQEDKKQFAIEFDNSPTLSEQVLFIGSELVKRGYYPYQVDSYYNLSKSQVLFLIDVETPNVK